MQEQGELCFSRTCINSKNREYNIRENFFIRRTMKSPVYVVTGSLDAGKTNFKLKKVIFLLIIPFLLFMIFHGPADSLISTRTETGAELPGLNAAEKKITISDDLFGMWYSELYLHMEQYTGYTIVITGYVLKDPESFGKDEFAAARLAMTCCVADLAPAGSMCSYPGASDLKEDSWVTVEGTLTAAYEEYGGHKYANPLIMVSHIMPAEPVDGYVYPY